MCEKFLSFPAFEPHIHFQLFFAASTLLLILPALEEMD
jgi:hypothetical protein